MGQLASGKVMEQIIRETISKHIPREKVTVSSQHGSMEEKSCLTNLIGFYDQMTGLVDEGRAVDITYLDFSQAFNRVSHRQIDEVQAR